LLSEAFRQLEAYLAGKLTVFSLPLAPAGTPFQRSVWKVLETIPYGKTWSYKDVAVRVGNPKATRAVGMANNRNPISIVVPCHRVIGADGSLVGYGGGLERKAWLLGLEARGTR
jgi:methylated-DNA-[protein]-cysteine S-methyltransferase